MILEMGIKIQLVFVWGLTDESAADSFPLKFVLRETLRKTVNCKTFKNL